jgi:uncharacterized protein (TIGR02444 family)
MLSLDNPFWQYSLQVYANSKVREICLQLQDEFSLNVNLLLLGGWTANQNIQLSAEDYCQLGQMIAPLEQQGIRPLRQIRRNLSLRTLLNNGWQEELRQRVLNVELFAEQIEQALLYAKLQETPRFYAASTTKTEQLRRNLQAYMQAANIQESEALRLAVQALVKVLATES